MTFQHGTRVFFNNPLPEESGLGKIDDHEDIVYGTLDSGRTVVCSSHEVRPFYPSGCRSYYVVRFACYSTDTPKVFLLSDDLYDRWVMAEPPEGYSVFELLQTIGLEELSQECLDDLRKLLP